MRPRSIVALVLALLLPLLGPGMPAQAAKKAAKQLPIIVKPVAVDEASGQVRITVALKKKATKNLKVSWTTVSGSATAGADFTAAHGKVGIKKGKKSAEIRVGIVDDAIVEAAETFTIAFKGKKLKPASATVTIHDNDGAGNGPGTPGSPGGGTIFPQTITGTFSVHTQALAEYGVTDSTHVEANGTVTYVFQPNDPYLGTRWDDGQVHYTVQTASVSWTASGECNGSGGLDTTGVLGDVLIDDVLDNGRNADADRAHHDYEVGLAPYPTTTGSSTGNMMVICDPEEPPVNIAGKLGQNGFGGFLIYNGFSNLPATNRYTPDLVQFTGNTDGVTNLTTGQWTLSGSGQAAYAGG